MVNWSSTYYKDLFDDQIDEFKTRLPKQAASFVDQHRDYLMDIYHQINMSIIDDYRREIAKNATKHSAARRIFKRIMRATNNTANIKLLPY